jgi:predicted dehydrogenase
MCPLMRKPDGVTFGVIGCGQWGPNYIRNFSSLPGTTVIAAADTSQARLNTLKVQHPTVHFTQQANEILHDESIDAVVISTPTQTHATLTKDALESGKHVLVEKPMCAHAPDGEELIRLARRKHKILMVGHTFLFNNGILKLKELLKYGDLGKIYYVNSTRTNLGPIRADVNAVYDLASHDVSIMNFLFDGLPTEVSAVGQDFLQKGIEDLAFISLRYPDDVLGRIHVSWLDPRKVREITIVGDKKMVTFDDLAIQGPVQIYDKRVVREPFYEDYGHFQLLAREGDITIPRVALEEPLKNQARYFLSCILKGTIEVSDGRQGVQVVRVLEAIQKSLRAGGAAVRIE